jgi:hypothetical protein
MSTFSASDAAFSGFRFIGRHPKTVLVWALANLVFQLLSGVVLVLLAGNRLSDLRTLGQAGNAASAGALVMTPGLSLLFLIALPAALGFSALMFAAAYRAVLRPSDAGPGYLKIGRDEFRMAVLIVAWLALTIGYLFLVMFVAGFAAGFVLGVTGAMGATPPAAVTTIFVILLLVGALAAIVYPLVRLSLSMPMTLAQEHIRLFESWRPTHGRFWALAGAILLCLVLIGVVLIVAAIVTTAIAAAVTLFAGGSIADISSIFTPTRLIVSVLNAPVSASVWAILVGPFAEAYLAFAGPGAHPSTPVPHPEPVGLSA